MEVTKKLLDKAKELKVRQALMGYEVGKYFVDERGCSCGASLCAHQVAVALHEGKEVVVVPEGMGDRVVLGYDKYEVVSAFHKEMRRGDVKAASYWLEVMLQSKFTAWYLNNYIVGIIGEELCTCDVEPIQHIKLMANYKVVDEYMLYAMVETFCEAKKWWFCKKCSDRRDSWCNTHEDIKSGIAREVPEYALDTHTRRGKQMFARGIADMRWSGTLAGMKWRRRVVEAGLDIFTASWDDVDMSDADNLYDVDKYW